MWTIIVPALAWKIGFIVIGIVLLFRGGGRSAFWIAVMCLAWSVSGNLTYDAIAPPALRLLVQAIIDLSFLLAFFGLMFFIQAACGNAVSPLIARTARAITIALATLYFVIGDGVARMAALSGVQVLLSVRVYPSIKLALFLIPFAYCALGYSRTSGVHRQRLAWIFWTTLIGLAGPTLQSVEAALGLHFGDAFDAVADWTPVLLPIGYTYAILKHHILDVSFVINRAVVYSFLTALVVGLFSLIDWTIGTLLQQARWALIVEIIAAISTGFWLNLLHSHVDSFVDRVLFRQRHFAEQRLKRVARGLPYVEHIREIAQALVEEPVEALGLRGAALLRRNRDGDFVCERSHGVDCAVGTLPAVSRLTVHLRGSSDALMLRGVGSLASQITGFGCPVELAVQVRMRSRLEAVAIYGAHVNGEGFDPDETRSLEELAACAALAYDYLEAESARKVIEEQAELIRSLEQRLTPMKRSRVKTLSQ